MAIAVMADLSALGLTVGRVNDIILIGVFPAVLLFANVLVMIACYSLMTVTMMLNVKAAHTSVEVANLMLIPGPSTFRTVTFPFTHVTRTAE